MLCTKNKRKIIIDGRKLKDFGIGTYISHIFKFANDYYKENLLLICYPSHISELINLNINNSHYIPTTTKLYSFQEHIILSYLINKTNHQLFHSPHYVVPMFIKCPTIVTIHDVIHLFFPSKGFIQKFIAKFLMKIAISKSSKIITVSNNSKTDIMTFFPDASYKITTIYNGVDEFFFDMPGEQQLKIISTNFSLPKKFILYVGNNLKHKNIKRLLKAFEMFSSSNNDYYLIFVGGIKKNFVRRFVKKDTFNKIIILPFLDRQTLHCIYYLSDFLVMPSLYEGFGLPVLEAMACRSAVLCSDIPVFKELFANIPFYINPYNTNEIADGMLKLSTNESLKAEIAEKGYYRAQEFLWENSCSKHIEVYETILNQ